MVNAWTGGSVAPHGATPPVVTGKSVISGVGYGGPIAGIGKGSLIASTPVVKALFLGKVAPGAAVPMAMGGLVPGALRKLFSGIGQRVGAKPVPGKGAAPRPAAPADLDKRETPDAAPPSPAFATQPEVAESLNQRPVLRDAR